MALFELIGWGGQLPPTIVKFQKSSHFPFLSRRIPSRNVNLSIGGCQAWPELTADWLDLARRPSTRFATTTLTSPLVAPRNMPMSSVYEDNFGFYCTDDDPEELAFFMHIKCQSVAKVCVRCNQKVRLQPQIILCATCSQALEYGAPSDPAWAVPNILCSSP